MPNFYCAPLFLTSALGALVLTPATAHAEDPAKPEAASPEVAPAPEAPHAEAPKPEVVPSRAPERKVSLDPKQSELPPAGRTVFDIDPVADGAMIAVSLGFASMLELINSTGEIRPQQISEDFHSSQLLWIDRSAVTQTVDPHAKGYSDAGLYVAAAYAVLDPILSGVREQSVQTALADAVLYAEAVSFTMAATNLVKMSVRRPRPIAYIEAEAHKGEDPPYVNSETDSALSFFSGHAAITATISSTATYLAFARSPHTARPWITLGVGTALTTFVAVERVRAGAHFPTDVIAGTILGAGIGLLVPHLHRSDDVKQRRIWVGFNQVKSREGERGGLLNVSGVF